MKPTSAPAPGPTGAAIFHLHPLNRCNLECGHCYSNSSPRASDMLTREQASGAIRQAAAWGYANLAISGGEPLLYPWLEDIIAVATDCGMRTALISNGLLAARKQNLALLGRLGTVAVSIDGLGRSHNAMRQNPRAFAGVLRSLATLREAGIGFSIICGVCSGNLDEIDEVAALACAAGAQGLQLHPITAAGRAASPAGPAVLDEHGAHLLYLASLALASHYQGRMGIHADLLHRRSALARPALLYAGDVDAAEDRLPADLLGVLVLEPDGTVNPVCYGFAPLYGLGNIHQQHLDQLWGSWRQDGYRRLLQLGRHVLDGIARGAVPALFNPSDVLCQASHRLAAMLPAAPSAVYHHQ